MIPLFLLLNQNKINASSQKIASKKMGGGKMGCGKCGGATKEWKCDVCGAISDEHVESHSCGGEHCVQMCAACSEAETNCKC